MTQRKHTPFYTVEFRARGVLLPKESIQHRTAIARRRIYLHARKSQCAIDVQSHRFKSFRFSDVTGWLHRLAYESQDVSVVLRPVLVMNECVIESVSLRQAGIDIYHFGASKQMADF